MTAVIPEIADAARKKAVTCSSQQIASAANKAIFVALNPSGWFFSAICRATNATVVMTTGICAIKDIRKNFGKYSL